MAYNSIMSRTDVAGIIPEDFLDDIFAAVPQQSAVLGLARRLRDGTANQMRLPILSALPMAYWVDGEAPSGGLKQTTKNAWKNKYIDYAEMAVIAPIPMNVLDDSGFPIWDQVRPFMLEAAGIIIDQAVLHGTNAPTSWPSAIVASATSAGNVVTLGTGTDIYDDILSEDGVYATVEADGFMVTGNLAHPTMMGRLRGLRDGAGGQPIFLRAPSGNQDVQSSPRYELAGVPVNFLRNGAFDVTSALMISGAWDQLVYSWRRDATFDVLREAVIQDADGAIVYNLAQQNMVALRMSARFGWQLPNPTSRLQATEGGNVGTDDAAVVGRYPFGILLPTGS